MPFSLWKGVVLDTQEVDRVAIFILRMYLKLAQITT